MKILLKNWRIRMVNYRQEADNAPSNITRLKAMNKFLTYRDCIKELEEAINYKHSCQKLKEGHKNSFKYWLEENNYKKVYDKYVKWGFEYSESELIAKYNEELMNL